MQQLQHEESDKLKVLVETVSSTMKDRSQDFKYFDLRLMLNFNHLYKH